MPDQTQDTSEADGIHVTWALVHEEIESADEYDACVRTVARLQDLIKAWGLTMADLPPITTDEVIAEIEREIEWREHYFPVWVDDGRITPKIAERRIALMREAADLCRDVVARQAVSGLGNG